MTNHAAARPGSYPGRKTLLIADSDMAFAEDMAREMRGEFDVVLAHDVKSACALIDRRRPGCVILDIRLGNENGFAVLEKLREENPETPTIVMSRHLDVPSAVKAARLGAIDCIIKPRRAYHEANYIKSCFESGVHSLSHVASGRAVALKTALKEIWGQSADEIEQGQIEWAQREAGDEIPGTAELLHMHDKKLRRRLKKYSKGVGGNTESKTPQDRPLARRQRIGAGAAP